MKAVLNENREPGVSGKELKNIAWIPSSSLYLNNRIFDENGSRDLVYQPFSELRNAFFKNGVNLDTYDIISNDVTVDVIIVTRIDYNFKILLNLIKKNPMAKVIYIVTEEATVCPIHEKRVLKSHIFDHVMTWIPEWIDEEYFRHCFYPNPWREFCSGLNFDEKLHLVMINSYHKPKFNHTGELYSFRTKLARYFVDHGLDLYGSGWHEDSLIGGHASYKGRVESKLSTMARYKFAFTIENTNNENGAVTEKIFDAMSSGCVPVYAGAPDIELYIPAECFINAAKFDDLDSLNLYLKSVTESEYTAYLKAIEIFLTSEAYKDFTSIGFVRSIRRVVAECIEATAPEPKNTLQIRMQWLMKILVYPTIFFRRKKILLDIISP